jgi:hypothetical protein
MRKRHAPASLVQNSALHEGESKSLDNGRVVRIKIPHGFRALGACLLPFDHTLTCSLDKSQRLRAVPLLPLLIHCHFQPDETQQPIRQAGDFDRLRQQISGQLDQIG